MVSSPQIRLDDAKKLEQHIDHLEAGLPDLESFILPGGDQLVSYTHISRNVCRRAEREVVRIPDGLKDFELIVIFLNRLSDFLFVLSRQFCVEKGIPELKWLPKNEE